MRENKTKNSTVEWNYHVANGAKRTFFTKKWHLWKVFQWLLSVSHKATLKKYFPISVQKGGSWGGRAPTATERWLRQWHGAHSWQETSKLNRVKSSTGIFGGGAMIISSVETNAQDAHDSPADCVRSWRISADNSRRLALSILLDLWFFPSFLCLNDAQHRDLGTDCIPVSEQNAAKFPAHTGWCL